MFDEQNGKHLISEKEVKSLLKQDEMSTTELQVIQLTLDTLAEILYNNMIKD